MSAVLGPYGQVSPVPEDVNDSIRRLMSKPADDERAAEYRRLLGLWAEATAKEWVQAA